jgi:hypothetical protein
MPCSATIDAGDIGCPLQITLSACGDALENNFFRYPAAPEDSEAIHQLRMCHQVTIFGRPLLSITESCHPRGNDGDWEATISFSNVVL